MDYETWECIFCGWVLKFQRGRTDVSTYCDKCHSEMEQHAALAEMVLAPD